MLYDGPKPLRTLSLEDIEDLVQKDEIEYPIISEAEIRDRSKGDILTKALALVQTTWFLVQCLARARQHLAITELEISTAAFALLNLVTYMLWFDKPLNVKCPVRVRRKHKSGQELDQAEIASDTKDVGYGKAPKDILPEQQHCCASFCRNPIKAVFHAVLGPFRAMIAYDHNDSSFSAGENESTGQHRNSFSRAVVLAIVFGAIHCMAWSFASPSLLERRLWQISACAITVIPVCIEVASSFLFIHRSRGLLRCLHCIAVLALSMTYLVARVALIVLSVMALRSLPASAFETIDWSI